MAVYVSIDSENRIVGLNPTDMTGNSDWTETTEENLTTHTDVTYDEMFAKLSEEHGVALYKFVNSYAENRTAEEIAADIGNIPAPAPTQVEVNTANIEYIAMMEEIELEG